MKEILDNLVTKYGSQKAAAEAVGCSPELFNIWLKNGKYPRWRESQIQNALNART